MGLGPAVFFGGAYRLLLLFEEGGERGNCQAWSAGLRRAVLLSLKAFSCHCLLEMIAAGAQIVLGECSGCYGKRAQV